MKLRKIIYVLLFAVITGLSTSACNSEDSDPCGTGNETGIIMTSNTYIFWLDADYGQLTVEVKDSKGNVQRANYSTIDQYYLNTNGPAGDCSGASQQGNAVFTLSSGKKYTYTAQNIDWRFTGTIDLTCEVLQCTYIKVGPQK